MKLVNWSVLFWAMLAGLSLHTVSSFFVRFGWQYALLIVPIAAVVDRMSKGHKFWHGALAGIGLSLGFAGMAWLTSTAVPELRASSGEILRGTPLLALVIGLLFGILTPVMSYLRSDDRPR